LTWDIWRQFLVRHGLTAACLRCRTGGTSKWTIFRAAYGKRTLNKHLAAFEEGRPRPGQRPSRKRGRAQFVGRCRTLRRAQFESRGPRLREADVFALLPTGTTHLKRGTRPKARPRAPVCCRRFQPECFCPRLPRTGGVTIWLWIHFADFVFSGRRASRWIEVGAPVSRRRAGVYLWAKEVFGDFPWFSFRVGVIGTNNMMYVPDDYAVFSSAFSVFVLGPGPRRRLGGQPSRLRWLLRWRCSACW